MFPIAGAYDCAVSLGAEPLPANRRVSSTRYPRSETSIRALIIGGGIGGLAAVVALQRVGIEAVVFERSPRLAEVGAGLSLWANAMIALRRLGLETVALDVGSVIQSTRTFSPQGKAFDRMDIAALGRKVGASSNCLYRATLQRILLDAAHVVHPASVEIGRECVGFEADKAGIFAFFADGSQERGDLLIGADGVHSVIRRQLFGDENLRFAGYVAWRGVADTAIKPPLDREPLIVLGAARRADAFVAGMGGFIGT